MINPELERYTGEHTTPEWPVLAELCRETQLTQTNPRMLAGHLQGTFLRMISRMIKPRRILEIGTFTGYSAINLAAGLEKSGILHTIEVDPGLEDIISRYIKDSGLSDKIVCHIGDALEIIPSLDEKWDLVYIDADKPNYLDYYHLVFDRVHKGGFILADNALWSGKVLDSHTSDKETLGIMAFNDFIQKDDRVENILLPIRDGIMMARKVIN